MKNQYKNAALIYNPVSGRRRELRQQILERAAAELERAGIHSTLIAPRSPGDSAQQAHKAVDKGHDVVFACGGDGTVNGVLQGMVSSGGNVPLGILPLGTGNVLAYDLGIPQHPESAIQVQLGYAPRRIAVGKIEFERSGGGRDSRYFTVTAGIGVDAEMLYRVTADAKQRWGMLAYSWHMTRMALEHKFELFEVQWRAAQQEAFRRVEVSQVLAVRVNRFGPLLTGMAPEAGLARDSVNAVLYSTRKTSQYLKHTLAAFLRRKWQVAGIEWQHATEILCNELPKGKSNSSIYAEADGEVLGRLPVRVSVVPNAFTLLMKE